MEPKLFSFLRTHGFADGDVQFLCASCPDLDEISSEDALQNINLVVQAGYPEEDIGTLIALNPNFLFYDYKQLAKTLSTLGDDIEETLKNEPFLL
ncbi:MAG: hypothetical protein MJ060_01255 [Clostridia bacterium]|nr:hypothetical protein [Clostridia bacterium]